MKYQKALGDPATKSGDIAISTNSISKLIIEDVNKKRFKDK